MKRLRLAALAGIAGLTLIAGCANLGNGPLFGRLCNWRRPACECDSVVGSTMISGTPCVAGSAPLYSGTGPFLPASQVSEGPLLDNSGITVVPGSAGPLNGLPLGTQPMMTMPPAGGTLPQIPQQPRLVPQAQPMPASPTARSK